jgi:hypothetical protein
LVHRGLGYQDSADEIEGITKRCSVQRVVGSIRLAGIALDYRYTMFGVGDLAHRSVGRLVATG